MNTDLSTFVNITSDNEFHFYGIGFLWFLPDSWNGSLDSQGFSNMLILDKVKVLDHLHISSTHISDFYPIQSRGGKLDLFQKLAEQDLITLITLRNKHIPIPTWQNGKQIFFVFLKEDTNITMKEADKGWISRCCK